MEGVIIDGDLWCNMDSLLGKLVCDIVNIDLIKIELDMLVVKVLVIVNVWKIIVVLVVDEYGVLVGILYVYDLFCVGVV